MVQFGGHQGTQIDKSGIGLDLLPKLRFGRCGPENHPRRTVLRPCYPYPELATTRAKKVLPSRLLLHFRDQARRVQARTLGLQAPLLPPGAKTCRRGVGHVVGCLQRPLISVRGIGPRNTHQQLVSARLVAEEPEDFDRDAHGTIVPVTRQSLFSHPPVVLDPPARGQRASPHARGTDPRPSEVLPHVRPAPRPREVGAVPSFPCTAVREGADRHSASARLRGWDGPAFIGAVTGWLDSVIGREIGAPPRNAHPGAAGGAGEVGYWQPGWAAIASPVSPELSFWRAPLPDVLIFSSPWGARCPTCGRNCYGETASGSTSR